MAHGHANGWDAGTVAALRSRLTLTQERFAHEVGVTASTVWRWERGKARPRGLALRRLDELAASETAVSE